MSQPLRIENLSVAYQHGAGNIELNDRQLTFWKKAGDWLLVEHGVVLLSFKAKTPLAAITRMVEWLQRNPLG